MLNVIFVSIPNPIIAEELVETVDVAAFRFNADHLSQFVKGIKTTSFSEDILNFSHTSSFSQNFTSLQQNQNMCLMPY